MRPSPTLLSAAALVLSLPLAAQTARERLIERDPAAAPIARALRELGPDVQTFNQHVVTLANPFFEGRIPGSRGMEIAREYFEFYLKKAGTQPPFAVEGSEQKSYRQAFPMRKLRTLRGQTLKAGDHGFTPDVDFAVSGSGRGGEVTGPLVFAGYAVVDGPDGYVSDLDGADLTGKVVLALRYEPTDEDGKSRWATGRRPWSRHGIDSIKLRNLSRADAAAVILVDPPAVADERAGVLPKGSGSGRPRIAGPVARMTAQAADAMLQEIAADTTIAALTAAADRSGKLTELGGAVTLGADFEEKALEAYNVAGMVPGKGALADEWIVIGGHLDHLGTGRYGARDRSRIGEVHPGADDNASGSAAVLMLADRIAKDYQELPAGTPARSILFIGFDAEEAGLYGARHYVEHPVAPIGKHALMINFDMIGRIVNKRLSVSGARSAEGMEEWLDPLFEASPLEIVTDQPMPGGSDHMAFMSKRVPYLFGIIADFHSEYHTPDDVSFKINRVDAMRTIDLFHKVGMTAATRTEPFVWKGRSPSRRRAR